MKEIRKYFKIYNILPVAICFLLGRIRLFEFFSPLAVAASACFGPGLGAVCGLFSLLGMLSKGAALYTYKYFFIYAAFLVVNPIISEKLPEKEFSVGLVPLISVLTGGSAFGAFYDFSAHYMILNAIEGLFSFFAAYVLDRGFGLMDPTDPKKYISPEDVISIIVIFSGVICGAVKSTVFGADISCMLIALFMLTVCFRFGCASGACCGSICALLLFLQDRGDPDYFPILSLGGFLGGFLRGRNRGLTAGIFIAALFLLCIGFDREMLAEKYVLGIVSGATAFLFLPDRLYFRLSSVFSTGIREPEEYIEQAYAMVESTLKSYSFSFRSLGAAFGETAAAHEPSYEERIEKMLDETVCRMCAGCSLRDFCWDKNYYITYESIAGMFIKLDRDGYMDIGDVRNEFKRACVAIGSFVQMAERVWEKERCERIWSERLGKTGAVMRCCLDSISELLDGLSSSFKEDLSFDKSLSLRLAEKLRDEKIYVKNISAGKMSGGRPEILVSLRNCDCTKRNTDRIIEAINEVTGERIMKDNGIAVYDKYNRDLCTIRLIGENRLHVGVKILRETKGGERVSGDAHTFTRLKDGTYLLALSDGMGSGEPAREESAVSLDLFRDFISAGFSKEAAIRLINTCLEFGGREDSFATLDACIINLYSGDASFIKTGACPTYILRDGKVSILEGKGLPVGILQEIKPEILEMKLRKNDTVIMITDGVTESFRDIKGERRDLKDIIEENSDLSYHKLCEAVFDEAKQNYRGRIKDDITVLSARIY